ncbi:MAG: class B sortase [Clostridia bacterium]|nr:class B sortase [Clostridia bacterium]
MKDDLFDEAYPDFLESAKQMISDDGNKTENNACDTEEEDDDDVKIADFSSGSEPASSAGQKKGKTIFFDKVTSSEGVFLKSVMAYSSTDIKSKKQKKTSRPIGFIGVMRLLIFCVCIGVFAWSVMKIVQSQIDVGIAAKTKEKAENIMNEKTDDGSGAIDLNSDKRLSDLISLVADDPGEDNQSEGNIVEIHTDKIAEKYGEELANDYRALQQNILKLQEQNPETFAYIRIANAGIRYPVMLRNSDSKNEYYLRHDFYHTEIKSGSIFADYKVDPDYDKNRNVVIYGHCMTDGSMFRPIKWLFDDKENRQALSEQWEIEIITSKSIYIYKIFSGYRSEGNRFIQNIKRSTCSDNDFERFLSELKQRSFFKNDLEYDGKSRIVTLSTCTNVKDKPDERYVIHGILTSVITF